jgi:type IV secretory pathway VirB10-like protein
MKAKIAEKRLRGCTKLALALAAAALLAAGEARAQQNPVRALTNVLGWTKDTDEGPDFVQQTRPDLKELGFSHVTGVDKPRVAVKTPAELEADKAALMAERGKAEAARKKLQAEKVEAVAPNRPPPIKDE